MDICTGKSLGGENQEKGSENSIQNDKRNQATRQGGNRKGKYQFIVY